jgi:NAD(P)-dependent dehydrogenase (short-subunit alcohol dehydrogenase family)
MSAMRRKQVLVTGAGRGLGRAIVDSLVERDWEVWATDVTEIDPAASKAQHMGVLDVCDAEAVSRLIGAVPGGLDALVNNAAISPLKRWDELDLATWNKTLQVNLTGPFICSQAAGRVMRDHGRGGAIVNLSSVTFFQGNPLGLHYTASKGGIVALTRSLAVVLGQYGIRVNCVAPGLMRTEGVMALVESGVLPGERLSGDKDPLRLLPGHTEPTGVADVIAFLLSADAREMTGQVIVASGGTFLY